MTSTAPKRLAGAAAVLSAVATVAVTAGWPPYGAPPPLVAGVAACFVIALVGCLVIAWRGGWRKSALHPLLVLLCGPVAAVALPWSEWQANRALRADRPAYDQVAKSAAHGDLGETTHAGPRWVRLSAGAEHLAAGGEIHVVRTGGGALVWFPWYLTPWFGGGGGMRWEIHDAAPDGIWRYHAR